MQTLPVPTQNVKAYRATLRDEAGSLTKINGEILFFHDETGDIVSLDPEDCVWLCVLGEIGLSGCQALMDHIHGGPAGVACSREEGVR